MTDPRQGGPHYYQGGIRIDRTVVAAVIYPYSAPDRSRSRRRRQPRGHRRSRRHRPHRRQDDSSGFDSDEFPPYGDPPYSNSTVVEVEVPVEEVAVQPNGHSDAPPSNLSLDSTQMDSSRPSSPTYASPGFLPPSSEALEPPTIPPINIQADAGDPTSNQSSGPIGEDTVVPEATSSSPPPPTQQEQQLSSPEFEPYTSPSVAPSQEALDTGSTPITVRPFTSSIPHNSQPPHLTTSSTSTNDESSMRSRNHRTVGNRSNPKKMCQAQKEAKNDKETKAKKTKTETKTKTKSKTERSLKSNRTATTTTSEDRSTLRTVGMVHKSHRRLVLSLMILIMVVVL